MRMIARRELGEVLLREGFIRRNLLIEIDDNVIDRLLEQGFNPTYGARPLKRAVEQLIVLPLARYLASRNRTNIDLIRVSCIDGKIELSTTTFAEHEQSSRIELDGGMLSSSGRRIRLDDQGLVAAFADLRRRLQDWNERPAIQEMQNERATALAETNKPTFWDDGNKARSTLARFYFLDRLLNRLKQLSDRVEYLEELSALVQKQRDARYRAELATSYEQIENDFSFFEIELLCAHLHDNHSAFIVLKRIGSAVRQEQPYAWLVQLASIYLQWAQRKGYEIEVALLKPPSLPKEVNPSITLDVWLKMNKWREAFQPTRLIGSNSAEWTKELESQNDIHAIGIFLQGTNVFGFLKGEIGTHRRNEILPSGERTQSLLAVDVHNFIGEPDSKFLDQLISIQDERVADANSQSKSKKGEQKSPKPSDNEPSVIRTYQFDGERLVRDMRTGVKISNVEPILEGKIDELILAYLRDEESKQAWEISD